MPRKIKLTLSPPLSPVEAIVERVDATQAGSPSANSIRTGFPSIDRTLGGGLRRQDLIVLGGDVGSGKSSLALGIALRAAQAGAPTLFLSGEMSEERVLERALAIEGRAAVDDLRAGNLDDLARGAVGAAAVRIRDLPFRVQPFSGLDDDELERALATESPPRALLVVDSIQQVWAAAQDAEERIGESVRTLKRLALEHDVAVLAVAHLPRLLSKRRDPRPTLDDLGGLGTVKQLADVVLAIYREEMYQPGRGMEGATELIVGKNRNGATGFVDLYFYQRWLRFEDMLEPDR
jgi:replicative DNA helicase